jgi:hypothetical protein
MRKITKTCLFSLSYKAEHDIWEATGANHPKYTSSHYKHYFSIKMELLRCQDGLCAYTEKRLCPAALYESSKWVSGAYVYDKNTKIPDISDAKGDLEHFDSSLKPLKAWLWDNLFVVDGDANAKKLEGAVLPIFKPDNPNYDPHDWLEYDMETHLFIPRPDLTDCPAAYDAVKNMLKILGINLMKEERRIYLADKIDDIQMHFKTIAQVRAKLEQFPTAFEFCVAQLSTR